MKDLIEKWRGLAETIETNIALAANKRHNISLSAQARAIRMCADDLENYNPEAEPCPHCGANMKEHYALGANGCPCDRHKI